MCRCSQGLGMRDRKDLKWETGCRGEEGALMWRYLYRVVKKKKNWQWSSTLACSCLICIKSYMHSDVPIWGFLEFHWRSQGSVNGILTSLWTVRSQVWLLLQARNFFSSPKCPEWLSGPSSLLFSRDQRKVASVWNWLLTSIYCRVKNEWNYTPATTVSLMTSRGTTLSVCSLLCLLQQSPFVYRSIFVW